MLLFCLYRNNPWCKKGSKQTKYLTACLPQDLSHKGMLSDLQERTPPWWHLCVKNQILVYKKNVYSGLVSAETYFSRRETLWCEAQRRAAVASPVPTTLPQPQLPWGGEREVRKEESRGKKDVKFSHACISAYADNLPVCCTFNHTFQYPSETIPSLSLKSFKRKTKTSNI